jgi:hypothetical protein
VNNHLLLGNRQAAPQNDNNSGQGETMLRARWGVSQDPLSLRWTIAPRMTFQLVRE